MIFSLFESKEKRILKKLAGLYPNDLCRPGVIYSKLKNNKYYAGIHIFGDSVRYRTIVFNCTGSYKDVIRKIEGYLDERIQKRN